MTPIDHDAVASWLEERHLEGSLRGMSWAQMEAEIMTDLGLDVDAGQIYGALMDAGSRRERRAAAARLGDIPVAAADKPLCALAPTNDDGRMVHEDDGGAD